MSSRLAKKHVLLTPQTTFRPVTVNQSVITVNYFSKSAILENMEILISKNSFEGAIQMFIW